MVTIFAVGQRAHGLGLRRFLPAREILRLAGKHQQQRARRLQLKFRAGGIARAGAHVPLLCLTALGAFHAEAFGGMLAVVVQQRGDIAVVRAAHLHQHLRTGRAVDRTVFAPGQRPGKAGLGQHFRAVGLQRAAAVRRFAVHIARKLSGQRHAAAGGEEFPEDAQRARPHGEHAREQHLTIARLTHAQEHAVAAALHAGHALERLLVGVVEVQMCARQLVEHVGVALLQRPFIRRCGEDPLRPADVGKAPCALDGAEHQRVAQRLALTHHQAEAGEIGLQLGKIPPVGRLIRDAGGIVALALALHGVPRQVRAAHVHAQQRLPVANHLVHPQIRPPARAAVQLGQHPFLALLAADRAALHGDPVAALVLAEEVDARPGHVLVGARQRAVGNGLIGQAVFVQHVAGQDDVVAGAPVVDAADEALVEQIAAQIEVVHAQAGDGPAVQAIEHLGHAMPRVVAVAPAELVENVVGVEHGAGARAVRLGSGVVQRVAAMGLVGEDAADGRAKTVAAAAGVFLVGQLDEPVHGLDAHGVDVGVAVVVAAGRVGHDAHFQQAIGSLAGQRREGRSRVAVLDGAIVAHGHAVRADARRVPVRIAVHPALTGKPRRGIALIEIQALHAQPRVLGDLAAAAAAGPAILVVQPCLQAALRARVGQGVDAVEPLVAHVLGNQPRAGVHEKSAEAHLLHHVHLAQQLALLQLAVPRPEGLPAIRAARALKLRPQFLSVHSPLPPPPLRGAIFESTVKYTQCPPARQPARKRKICEPAKGKERPARHGQPRLRRGKAEGRFISACPQRREARTVAHTVPARLRGE